MGQVIAFPRSKKKNLVQRFKIFLSNVYQITNRQIVQKLLILPVQHAAPSLNFILRV
jgi:hypothetical protein